MRKKESCPKCYGTGTLPRWPNPPCILPSNVIAGIKNSAPNCDQCGGSGYVYKEEL